MKKETYDIFIIGPLSRDIMIDFRGKEDRLLGGACVQSGYAASNIGGRTAVFTKASPDTDVYSAFENCPADIFWRPSARTTSICNRYFTEDKEKRTCTLISRSDRISFEELPPVTTRIYQFAGLIAGDFADEIFRSASFKGKVAADVQCLLRHGESDGSMVFYDWPSKKEYLPFIDYLKTDAAEAEILTGYKDRYDAAKQMYDWGAKEIMITHNTEVLVYDGSDFYACPIRARNLSGRTGRGDTAFAGYIVRRLHSSISESLLFATALVSLKMETPGPFTGTYEDVKKYMDEFYTDRIQI